ncbi:MULTISPECIES: hypothetical protein [Pseudomonas]
MGIELIDGVIVLQPKRSASPSS